MPKTPPPSSTTGQLTGFHEPQYTLSDVAPRDVDDQLPFAHATNCSRCGGRGQVTTFDEDGPEDSRECPWCGGSGSADDELPF